MMETVPSGTVLHGRYRIERVLGSGGFGHVYLALDLQTSQQYAIKEYLVTGANGQAQLQHEARVLSQLHHPNLPAYQEAFIERGHYYVVISYIEGSDLTDYIRITRQRNEAIPLSQVVSWLISICEAVMFMHNQRPPFIHRDIKPDNIRIMSNGVAMLVDLGNAKATGDGARTLFFIRHQGTPGYAPPEQYPGGTGTDVRSDVYALGGTLYFALTTLEPPSVSTRNQAAQQGRPTLPTLQEVAATNPPEESADAQAARQFRLGVSKPAKPAPRHSRHLAQLSQLSPEVLEELNRIIQRSMALKPKERYTQVADFCNDLKRVQAAIPVPQQSSGKRPVNPYATQPDLAHVYETLQESKGALPPENASGAAGQSNTIPCPQCQLLLPVQSTSCPRCGYTFETSAGQRGSNPGSQPSGAYPPVPRSNPGHQPSGAYPPVPRSHPGQATGDSAAHQFGLQQRQPQPIQLQPSGQHPSLARNTPPPASGHAAPNQANGYPPQRAQASRQPYASPTSPSDQQSYQHQAFANQPPKPVKPLPGNLQGTNLSMRTVIIIAALVLLVVIIVLILVISTHAGHASTFQFLEAQVELYANKQTQALTHTAFGLWARSQSLS